MITKIQSTTEAINLNVKNMEETPIKYAQRKLIESNNMKGIARIFISNMLLNSFLEVDKNFYLKALKELDFIKV